MWEKCSIWALEIILQLTIKLINLADLFVAQKPGRSRNFSILNWKVYKA